MENMKLKVKITGPRVHDVGYRYFLMSNAMDLGLKGFHARNRMSGVEQEIIALVEGDEEAIADFGKLVETRKPEHSKVSSIAFEDYEGDVMRAGEYAQVCTALQMNKAIPLLLKIQNNTSVTPQILEEIKGMRDDIQPGYGMHFRQVQSDVRAIKERLGMQ
jgi:acylphosphatase